MVKDILKLKDVLVQFGDLKVVNKISLNIKKGEFFSILGPSGGGKTTLIRVMAGFQEITSGSLTIDGDDHTNTSASERPTALIFQSLALFPLMSVAENIGFSLMIRKMDKEAIKARVDELIETIRLTGKADKKVTELSGGERQRVAIARALATAPKILLLDEPLSALDFKLRQHLRFELKELQRKFGITFIYITHDQSEALAMSDRVAVLSEGKLEQLGTPAELYTKPTSTFVMEFLGDANKFTVIDKKSIKKTAIGKLIEIDTNFGKIKGRTMVDIKDEEDIVAYIRPEFFQLDVDKKGNKFTGKIVDFSLEGSYYKTKVQTQLGIVDVNISNDGRDVIRCGKIISFIATYENTYILPVKKRNK